MANGLAPIDMQVAAIVPRTRRLGPGVRFAVWVQGCPFACPACISPDFIPQAGGRCMTAGDIVSRMGMHDDLDGVTVSGGEPFAQPRGLAAILSGAREKRLSTLVFSGFTLAQLRRLRNADVATALSHIDVLIDGLYQHALNNSRGLRGSGNQTVHFLTDRLAGHRSLLEAGVRETEVKMSNSGFMRVGVPSLAEWTDRHAWGQGVEST